jgi:hypothetical protein
LAEIGGGLLSQGNKMELHEYKKIGNGVIQKEFEEFLASSPFKGLSPITQQYIGMYGAFLAGYNLHQKEII